MTPTVPIPAVFDCTVFAQALINPKGPAGACVSAAQTGQVRLFVSDYCLGEIRELSIKLPAKLKVSATRVERFILDLARYSEPVDDIPAEFVHTRDPDDAPYVDLARVTGARFLVTRDRDLLDLMNTSDFTDRFPELQVVNPPGFLQAIDTISRDTSV
ncbi:MAG: putative toxin-antitoxin system toxin component, PIN family [Phycisphaeraceae bacterium]